MGDIAQCARRVIVQHPESMNNTASACQEPSTTLSSSTSVVFAAHELLRTIRMMSIHTERELGRAHSDYAAGMGRMLSRLAETVTYFADLSLIDGKVNASPVSVEQALDEAVDQLSSELQACDASLDVRGTLGHVEADPAMLHALFCNLTENAIRHARPDVPLIITIESKDELGRFILWFEDNGTGLPPVPTEQLFVAGTQYGERCGQRGLGLSILETLLTMYGGSITADENFDTGARFRIELPATTVDGTVGG